ncbi:uncharacterized protein CG3556 [Caerostris darwini]|uniref:Uncharacterized protein CG3556 n=1 Tax=Caerostris darwini TaxID=1538125 RepID=A0AAV4Q2J6_9ARAC|nr:uncharacterized protein CG3556 [Caerostris darwini]
MILFKYLKAILLILACKFCFASSDKCSIQSDFEGTIEESKYSSHFERCWKINVPPGSFVQLSLESYLSQSNCPRSTLKVTVLNRDEPYTFCPSEPIGMPIIAFDDVIIKFEINYPYTSFQSSFKMRYKIGKYFFIIITIKKTSVIAVRGISESLKIATKWLKNKWSYSSGWQENTHRGIIAWYLATERNDTDIEEVLMVKQLEVETLASLLRNDTSPLTVNQLSMFVNALTVSCRDPRNFHGFDLVKVLKQQTEVSSLTNHPTSYLALCNAGESLPINATSELSKILNSNSEYPFFLDLQAATIIVLSCLRHNNQDISNTCFPQTDFENTIERFKTLQKDDGSFGSIYTSAIVTQCQKMGEKLYIYDIDSITNDFENGQFWFRYLGQNNESMTHLTESLDKVTVKDGSHIIMWYKRAHI